MSMPRILVVDDEPPILRMVSIALTSRGYEVESASHPHIALELMRRSNPVFDVLVSDVIMPEMCGPELARHMVQMCPRSAVVLMSGCITPEALPKGAVFISKPFVISDLYRAVEKALGCAPNERHFF